MSDDSQHVIKPMCCVGIYLSTHQRINCTSQEKVKMAMKTANRQLATNGKQNMTVFGPHFEQVFDNHYPIDVDVLNDIHRCLTLHNIDSPITFNEVDVAINKLKNGKSRGLNGIPPEACKAMNIAMRQ